MALTAVQRTAAGLQGREPTLVMVNEGVATRGICGRFISACLLHTLAYHLGLRATAMAFLIVATPLLGCVAFDGAVIRSCLTPVRYATRDRVGRGP